MLNQCTFHFADKLTQSLFIVAVATEGVESFKVVRHNFRGAVVVAYNAEHFADVVAVAKQFDGALVPGSEIPMEYVPQEVHWWDARGCQRRATYKTAKAFARKIQQLRDRCYRFECRDA